MVESSNDLEGNIQLDTFEVQEENKNATTSNGFQPENRPASSASSQYSGINGETFNTLDEPVSETIVSTAEAASRSTQTNFAVTRPALSVRNVTWSASGRSCAL